MSAIYWLRFFPIEFFQYEYLDFVVQIDYFMYGSTKRYYSAP